MKILVLSCDNYSDLFEPFHYCIEKYWIDHPEIIYSTETIINPYYKTICKNYPIEKWSKRIHDTVEEIDDDIILMMCDDCFIQSNVNTDRLNEIISQISGDVASYDLNEPIGLTYEKYSDNTYIKTGEYKTSVALSIWQKDKLLKCFNYEYSPWNFELANTHNNFTFLINGGVLPIDFGRKLWKDGAWGIVRGKWSINAKKFFDKENFSIDYSKRGFYV